MEREMRSNRRGLNDSEVTLKKEVFSMRSAMPVSAEELFRWHARPGALERLTPPWESAEVLSRTGNGIEVGAQITIQMKAGPIKQRIVAEHTLYEEGKRFRDVMTQGPFSFWQHTHTMEPNGEHQSFLDDYIEYALPMGALGRFFGGGLVRGKLETAFTYRHHITHGDLVDHSRYQLPSYHIALSGSRGLIGSTLIPFLTTGGHRVSPLVRNKVPVFGQEIAWDPAKNLLAIQELEGLDAVIHLAGEPIASGRWTKEKKQKIRESRIESTRLLSESLAKLATPPKVLVCASAIGFYGDRGDEELTEESAMGQGFLAETCRDWELATKAAEEKGIRVVHLRTGIVLSSKGGVLEKLLTPFRLGVGGKLGSGSQWMSWIAIDDVLGVILRAIGDERLSGPVNVVASSCRNEDFSKTLAKILSRPSFFSVPKTALRASLGQAADEAVLASDKVTPQKLLQLGHSFRHTSLEEALQHLLGV
jgi:uncharacterized protein (TIGR01777 family)